MLGDVLRVCPPALLWEYDAATPNPSLNPNPNHDPNPNSDPNCP